MRHSTRCFTASKPMAPSLSASPTAAVELLEPEALQQTAHLDVLALAPWSDPLKGVQIY